MAGFGSFRTGNRFSMEKKVQNPIQRCGALTQKGKPCRNRATADGYCWRHKNHDRDPSNETTPEETEALPLEADNEKNDPDASSHRLMDAGENLPDDPISIPSPDGEELDLSDIEAALDETTDPPEAEDLLADDLGLQLELDFDSEEDDDDLDMDLGMEIEPEPTSAMDDAEIEFTQTSEMDLADLEKMLSESGIENKEAASDSQTGPSPSPPDGRTEDDEAHDISPGLEVLDMTGSDFEFDTIPDDEPEDDASFGSADIGLEMTSDDETVEDETIDAPPDIQLELEDIELLEPDGQSDEEGPADDDTLLDIPIIEEEIDSGAGGVAGEDETESIDDPSDVVPPLETASSDELVRDIPSMEIAEEPGPPPESDDVPDLEALLDLENPFEDVPIEEIPDDISTNVETAAPVPEPDSDETADVEVSTELDSPAEDFPPDELILDTSAASVAAGETSDPGGDDHLDLEMDAGESAELEMPFDEMSEAAGDMDLEMEAPSDSEPDSPAIDLDQTIELDMSDLPDFDLPMKEEVASDGEVEEEVTEADFSLEMEGGSIPVSDSIQDEEPLLPPSSKLADTSQDDAPDDAGEADVSEACALDETEGYWLEIDTVKAEQQCPPEKARETEEAAASEETPAQVEKTDQQSSVLKGAGSDLSDTWEIKPPQRTKPLKKIDPGIFAEKQDSIFKKRVTLPLPALLVLLLLVAGGIAMVGLYLWGHSTKDPGNLKMTAFATASKIVVNETLGPLFIITGNVQNSYAHDRTGIRVTGTLYIQGGFSKSVTVICGNTLSGADLSESDMKFITHRMQESNARKVSPGGVLPFMVVFSGLPDDLAKLDRYTVEVVGSKAL